MKDIALVYDVDYTLIEGYHPSLLFTQRNLDPQPFWDKIIAIQQQVHQDRSSHNAVYTAVLMDEIRLGDLRGLTIREMQAAGKELETMLYPGLPDFFTRLTHQFPQYHLSHNIVSVGARPILEGSVLAPYMDRIFACTFLDNLRNAPEIGGIATTIFEEDKVAAIRKISTRNGQQYPVRQMVYFGDGQTDKTAFQYVKNRGGLAICVYNHHRNGAYDRAVAMKEDVSYIVPADYREGSELWKIIVEWIDQ